MTDNAMVSVPLNLLAQVLDTAESDSYSTEAEFCCSDAEAQHYDEERSRIRQLRELAGITSKGVTGQGFFGVALALKNDGGSRR